MTVDLSGIQSPTVGVYDAGRAYVGGALLDRLFFGAFGARYSVGGESTDFRNSVRLRSHSLQGRLFALAGHELKETDGKRTTSIGLVWVFDDSLPLDCILLEKMDGTVLGRVENLYPACSVCLEYRVEQALRTAGLLKAQEGRAPIEVRGEPISETIIRERG